MINSPASCVPLCNLILWVSGAVSQVVEACRDGPPVVWFNPLFNIFVATFFPIQLPSHIKKIPLPWGKPSLIKQIQMKSFKDNLNNKNHSAAPSRSSFTAVFIPSISCLIPQLTESLIPQTQLSQALAALNT